MMDFEDYLRECKDLQESLEKALSMLAELRIAGPDAFYDENSLYDALYKMYEDISVLHGHSYMAVGTQIKYLKNSLENCKNF